MFRFTVIRIPNLKNECRIRTNVIEMKNKAFLVITTYLEDGDTKVRIGIFSEKNPSTDITRLIKQVTIYEVSAPTFNEAKTKLLEKIQLDL